MLTNSKTNRACVGDIVMLDHVEQCLERWRSTRGVGIIVSTRLDYPLKRRGKLPDWIDEIARVRWVSSSGAHITADYKTSSLLLYCRD